MPAGAGGRSQTVIEPIHLTRRGLLHSGAPVAYRFSRESRPHGGTMPASKHVGRHRLGSPGLVHCILHRPVAEALEEYRRTWLSALLIPAKHSLAGLRRKARAAAQERVWAPAT
jgi:hypothetical protein